MRMLESKGQKSVTHDARAKMEIETSIIVHTFSLRAAVHPALHVASYILGRSSAMSKGLAPPSSSSSCHSFILAIRAADTHGRSAASRTAKAEPISAQVAEMQAR